MLDLSYNPEWDNPGLLEKIQKAHSLKQELDYLKEQGVIDDHQYNILLNSNVDLVEKLLPKIYDTAIQKAKMEQELQLKQQEAQQPQWQVEFIKTDNGVKMVAYNKKNPQQMWEKQLTKTQAKKAIKELNKKWKAQIVNGKVVYIPPTPQEDIVVKDLGKYGIKTTAKTAGGKSSGGVRFQRLYGN